MQSDTSTALQGYLRLLICDRFNKSAVLSISKESFLLVEDAFNLHPATIPSLFRHGGVFFKQISYDSRQDEPERVNIVVKACQKVEVANYLLSFSHHLPTGVTTAFICGDGAMEPRDFDQEPQFDHILTLIRSSVSLWTHPMFLPTVLLQNHWRRTENRSNSLGDAVPELEGNMGVSSAATTAHIEAAADWPMNIDVRRMTILLHTTMRHIISMEGVCAWSCKFAAFLLETNKELQRIYPRSRSALMERASRQLLETLSYVDDASNKHQRYLQVMKERVHAQVSVVCMYFREKNTLPEPNLSLQLYNVYAQLDSRVNAKIALSTKEDSIAMKTLAFITALFLPGTFIATLFSTNMFNWQPSSSGSESPPLSSLFWVYWAVAAPLTILVLIGWFWWYKRANTAHRQILSPNAGYTREKSLRRQE